MSAWTPLRTHVRADGATVRIERSPAGRWQVSVRAGVRALDVPTQWLPGRLGEASARAIVATFAQRCIQPMALGPDLAAELTAARARAVYAPDEARLIDLELTRGRPKALALALGQLAARQRDAGVRAALDAVVTRIWTARAEALAALPPAVHAPLVDAGTEVRRGG
jgi:hypothetical protein